MPLPAPGPTSRVAPTAKIPDDAPLAPPTRPGPLSGQQPNVSYAPPAMPTPPPGSLQAPVIPHTSRRPPQPRAPVHEPMGSSSSFSAPMHTPLGLIAVVLIVDLALAGAGAFLLAKGLSTPAAAAAKDAPAPAAPTPEQKSEAPPSPAAPVPAEAPPAPPPPDVPAAAPPKVEKPEKATKPVKATKPAKASARRPSATTSSADVSKPVSTESEINAKVMGSHTAFGHCREQAGEVHGDIQIAFRVLGDGHIGNASIVEDTTGSASLAACLRDTISTWNVTPHNGAPLSFVRPFTYP
jgi:hypothetical protein